MPKDKGIFFLIFTNAVLICSAFPLYGDANQEGFDWSGIWQKPMPSPVTVEIGKLGGLGEDLENREWQMVSTKYHEIYFQPSLERKKVSEVYLLIDNVYEFLEGRSTDKPAYPIKAFLVPGQTGRSRCSSVSNAMRTGDKGDVFFIITSLLHEETHLFNFAFLDSKRQGWWAGEFTCIYFQQRALWGVQGKDIKKEIVSRLPERPGCRLEEMGESGREVFDEAFSVLYFLETKYGRQKINEFRQACLEESLKTGGKPLNPLVFAKVFGKTTEQLEQEWLEFYGWGSITERDNTKARDPRLNVKVSYATEKGSVQDIVRVLANKAGLNYNMMKSLSQTDSLSRRWVLNVDIKEKPLHESLEDILGPVGLSYKLEGDTIVLTKK
jgi:hypothetical protein